jgi:hypothetical protein
VRFVPASARAAVRAGVFLFAAAICVCGSAPPVVPVYTAFKNPELVTIQGYPGHDAMEPFISRDGAFLFFNTDGGGPTEKDIFFASSVDALTFQYQGAVSAVNSSTVDGAPSMDAAGTFFYVSLAGYNPPVVNATLHAGTWNGSTVNGIASLGALTYATPCVVYFDIEASPDGSMLYLSLGDFRSGGGAPSTADIVVAVKSGADFALDPSSPGIMANINTDKLEYAPSISADGLEFFFTRMDLGAAEARIYRSTRVTAGGAFGTPELVSAIGGFVEGGALSPDEKSLYYHKKNMGTGRFEIYRVTRQ